MISYAKSRCVKLACAGFALLITMGVNASELALPTWHGQISQGFIKTNHNNFFGDSEDYSWELTDIAVGTHWQPLAKVQFSTQLLYRQAGALSRDDIYTDYALVDITLAQSMLWKTGTRAGRIKNPLGFYNDTRDIAANRPSILLPESIYQNLHRDAFHSSDSVSLYGHSYFGDHLVQIDLLHGKPILNQPTTDEILPPLLSGKLKGKKLNLARFLFEFYGGTLRAAYTHLNADINFSPDNGSQIIATGPMSFMTIPLHGYSGSLEYEFDIWSLEYNYQNWQFTSEFQTSDITTLGIGAPVNTKDTRTATGHYSMATYRFNTKWQGFIRYDSYYRNKKDKDGHDYAKLTGRPKHNMFGYDKTLGLRYQPNQAWLLAAEIHRINGTIGLSHQENNLAQVKQHWTLFTAQVSYKF